MGGAERQLVHLLPGLRERGFVPAIVTLRHQGPMFDEMRARGIDTRFASMRSRSDLRGMLRVVRSGHDADVVISKSIDAHVVGALIARRASVPHVAVEHAAPELLRDARRHHVLAYRWVAPRVESAVAVSTTQIPEMIGLGFRERSIRVIPNGIPELEPVRTREELRSELGIDERHFVVTLIATLRAEKRAELFVDAVAEASRTEPSVRGLVVGGGPHLEQVRARAARDPGIVKVLGQRSEIADLIAASDAIGLSSIAECVPLSVLEAMALARPVVGTDVGGMREPVGHEQTGLLVPPNDSGALAGAIVRLARDRDLASAMGLAGRRRYEQTYTVDRMIDAFAELLGELAGAGQARSLAG
jgi:glycosyltransferase involved in cell wall biosynthesis